MKKKIGALLLTVAMAVALLAGPALARDSDDSNHDRWRGGNEWREYHPYQGYEYRAQPRWNYATATTTTIGVGPGKTMTDGEAITAGGVITTAIATKQASIVALSRAA
jgi:hypothetical protein